MQCGLLGRKLSHSYSPQIHRHLGTYPYQLYEIEPEELEAFFTEERFTGINVTIPYKKAVLPYCSRLSDCAAKLGAVNTVVRQADGTYIGHNTDYFGFSSMVKHSGLSVCGKKVLVLGSGGAAATVVAVLKELGSMPVIISRTGENNYTNLNRHADAAIIVNTTPVGMYPNTDQSPINLDLFPALEGVLDLIYNPAHTKLLQQAEAKGLIAENGLWMLVAQAKESAEWFTGSKIDDSLIATIHEKLRLQMENIVLIGMPGCGKSTVGKLLAKTLNKTFVDADEQIVISAGISIPEIFQRSTEDGFRKIETQVLAELGKKSGQVIATGGGCITREENYAHLHQNGRIIWLQREVEKLPVEGRPLSQKNNLTEMYEVRKPLYEAFADITVNNNAALDVTINEILDILSGRLI